MSEHILIYPSDDRIFISNQTGNSVLIAICTLSTGPKILDLRDSKQQHTLGLL